MNIKEIIEAWIIAGNPNDRQVELAKKRAEICNNCYSKKELIKKVKISTICSECGCPIAKKIFTNSYDPCPSHKWYEVDSPYFSKQKSNKSLL